MWASALGNGYACADGHLRTGYLHLVDLVRDGELKEKQLDNLIAPMLLWKFKMGLFDDPYVDPNEAEAIVGCE